VKYKTTSLTPVTSEFEADLRVESKQHGCAMICVFRSRRSHQPCSAHGDFNASLVRSRILEKHQRQTRKQHEIPSVDLLWESFAGAVGTNPQSPNSVPG
jgi:hypothetical protein